MASDLSRRAFLSRTAALGCSLAASPLVTPVTFAATPGENRLVVIILRGAMDGLATVMPYGDPEWPALRGKPDLSETGAADLDGFFAMHHALRPLLPLWKDKQLGFVHAVSTPYRDKRSHFDGQDLLEAGIADLSQGLTRDGWLNRMLQHYPGVGTETAYAVGRDSMLILSGDAPVSRWSPEVDLTLSPQALRLAELVMQDDPAFSAALAQAFSIADNDGDAVASELRPGEMVAMMRDDQRASRGTAAEVRVAEFVARRLRDQSRIASFSINGWDTHDKQDKPLGRALGVLSEVILTLRKELGGPAWNRTTVVAMTEFGRTARMNGTLGTDHGTGGAMILAGGAIRGGQVSTEWPGLSETHLYQRRDLMPTRDLRAHAGWLIHGLFGLDRSVIERDVFPGVELGGNPGLLL